MEETKTTAEELEQEASKAKQSDVKAEKKKQLWRLARINICE